MFKKFLFLMVCSILAAVGSAQPVLQNNVFPGVGDVITTVSADSNIISEGNAGGNQVWDFTNLQPAGDPFTSTFIDAGNAPDAASFPGANIAGVTNNNGDLFYSYFKLSQNQFSLLGSAYPGTIPQQFSNPETLLATPLTFNGTFTDNFASSQPYPDASTSSKGSVTATYDAYGTLKMPGGNFNNAIRLEKLTQQQDTIILFFGYAVTSTTETSYEWYVGDRPGPQVVITYLEGVSTTFFPGVPSFTTEIPLSKSISYVSSIATGVEEAEQSSNAFSLRISGANPVADELTLTATAFRTQQNLRLQLIDVQGKLLQSKMVDLTEGDNALSFTVGHLPAGTYLAQLSDGHKSNAIRWIKH